MIDPAYIAKLRHQYRSELVLTFVQLEQVYPGWWADLETLAIQLGTDRASLNRNICKLEKLNMVRRTSISNTGGTWVWWVKRGEDDKPQADNEPAWLIKRLGNRRIERIAVSQRWEWAKRHGVPRNTMRSFLSGGQMVLRGRWQLVATPHD